MTKTSQLPPNSSTLGLTDSFAFYDADSGVLKRATINELIAFIFGNNQTAWTPYTPSSFFFTIGNGTSTGSAYMLYGTTCFVRIKVTWGTTTAYNSGPGARLPFTPHADYAAKGAIGTSTVHDTGTGNQYNGLARITSTNMLIAEAAAQQSSATWAAQTSTTPQTWATGDILYLYATYEVANFTRI